MSGFVGILRTDGAPVDLALIKDLTARQAFRGPDAQNTWCEGPVALGHTLLRTSSRADAVAITSAFGGGGHARAAGATVNAPLEEAMRLVLEESERELDRADARGR